MSFGIFLYYLLWPLVWFYSPLTLRVRVIILCEGELLVVKNWFGSGTWQLPGGGIKIGESSIEAAVREIKEELSLELNPDVLELVTNEPIVHRQSGLIKRNFFVITKLKSKPKIHKSSEISDLNWINLEDFEFPQQISQRF